MAGVQSGVRHVQAAGSQLLPDQISVLARTLANAIQRGDKKAAGEVAKNLASEQAVLNIQFTGETRVEPVDNKHISLNVYIEDGTEGPDKTKVEIKDLWPTMMFLELKMLVFEQFGLPVECQKWIFHRRIRKDGETLADCGITTSGHSIFLYVVVTQSSKITCTREEYCPPDAAVRLSRSNSQASSTGSRSRTSSQLSANSSLGPSASLTPLMQATEPPPPRGRHMEPSHAPFQSHTQLEPNIPLTGGGGGGALPPQPLGNRPLEQEPFFWRPPGTKAARDPPNQVALDQLPTQSLLVHQQPPRMDGDFDVFPPAAAAAAAAGTGGGSSSGLPEALEPTPDGDGWKCPICTLVNHPNRPGCSACATARPDEYVVPDKYGPREQQIIANVQAEQQRLLEEAGVRVEPLPTA